tara:strand:- start:1306 stop:1851 length:546 start_codon:yes stop_codon:yes gene_type:complete
MANDSLEKLVNESAGKDIVDLFEDADSEGLGLKQLKQMLQGGGRNGGIQGGWDVHHIPEKWLWDVLELTGLITNNLRDKVPCIPLPGIGVVGGKKTGYAGKFSEMFEGDPPYHRGTGGLAGKLNALKAKLEMGNISQKQLLEAIVALYGEEPCSKTPMQKVFKLFINKVANAANRSDLILP